MDKKKASEMEQEDIYKGISFVSDEYLNGSGFDKILSNMLKALKKNLEDSGTPYQDIEIVYPVKIEPYNQERHGDQSLDDDTNYSWRIEYTALIKK